MDEHEHLRVEVVNTSRQVVIEPIDSDHEMEEIFWEPLFYMMQKCEKLALVCNLFNRIREEFRPRIVIRHSGFGTGVPQDIVTQQDWLYNFWRHHLYNYTIHYKRERKRTLPQSEFLRRKYLERMKNGEIGSSSQSGGHRGRIMYDPYKDGDPPSDYVFPMF